MNTYEAIMRAADHIQRNPKDFEFDRITVPRDCGTPGCALGWIGYYADLPQGEIVCDVARRTLGMTSSEFYNAMDKDGHWWQGSWFWIWSSWACAHAMRQFAKRYKPARHSAAFKPWLADLMRKVEGETIPA